jgi:UDP-glucose 4-epimerase
MRILITGGAGCLGSNLIEHWLPLGHEICVIDDFTTGKREVVPNIEGLTLFEGSIVDYELLHVAFQDFRPDIVINAAASYKDPNDWLTDTQTNVVGSINIAKVCEQFEVNKLINFQTALCYGSPTSLPIPITHPTNPFTSYGISKTAGEEYLLMSPVPTISLRLANVTGPRLSIGPIPTFYKRLKTNQSCFCSDTRRDFLDMADFLDLMDIILSSNINSGVFNVSTGKSNSIKDIFDNVASHLGLSNQNVPIVPAGDDDVVEVVLDPSETKQAFSWSPKFEFEDIIRRQLEWYDDHGVSDVYSHLKAETNVIE